MLIPDTARALLDASTETPEGAEPQAHEAAADLHTRTVDALKGYARMLEKAEPTFRPVVQRFHDLHSRHATALAAIVAALGGTVDADGSFMGTINQTVVSLRAFFDEIDEDVMDSVRSGEDHVLKAFDGALEFGLPPDHEAAIVAMRDELVALLDETRHLD
ncbi:MAG: DUF2383 domain-containing protein [Pseudomonadota bacterium]